MDEIQTFDKVDNAAATSVRCFHHTLSFHSNINPPQLLLRVVFPGRKSALVTGHTYALHIGANR